MCPSNPPGGNVPETFHDKWQAATEQLEGERLELVQRVTNARTLIDGLEDELERIRQLIGHPATPKAATPVSGNPSASGGGGEKKLVPIEEPPPPAPPAKGGGLFRK